MHHSLSPQRRKPSVDKQTKANVERLYRDMLGPEGKIKPAYEHYLL